MDDAELSRYKGVQDIARRTMDYLESVIIEGVSESDIAEAANRYMLENGASSFWYHGVGSLVLVGERTILSVSGRNYEPASLKVGKEDLVTVDLGPQIDSYWADFARSFVIGDGRLVTDDSKVSIRIIELESGLDMTKRLHARLLQFASPETTFGELYTAMNGLITDTGYRNLDYRGNLGHSIERHLDERRYIEDGSEVTLRDAGLFTFEPHISTPDGKFGFKREDIYYFLDGTLRKL